MLPEFQEGKDRQTLGTVTKLGKFQVFLSKSPLASISDSLYSFPLCKFSSASLVCGRQTNASVIVSASWRKARVGRGRVGRKEGGKMNPNKVFGVAAQNIVKWDV